MKLNAQFYSKENKLFKLDGTPVSLAEVPVFESTECIKLPICVPNFDSLFCALQISWETIGISEENYDESFLASLRDFLKMLESKGKYAFIIPNSQQNFQSKEKIEDFTKSFVHCARRVKDCANLVGFFVPTYVPTNEFIESFLKKHPHYIFFSSDSVALENENIVCFQ